MAPSIETTVQGLIKSNQADKVIEIISQQLLLRPKDLNDLALKIGALLLQLYDDYYVQPVEEFFHLCFEKMDFASANHFIAPIKEQIEFDLGWDIKLETVYNERLARDFRDSTMMGDFDTALQRLSTIVSQGKSIKAQEQKAMFLGRLLGSISTHREHGETLLKMLRQNMDKCGLTLGTIGIISEERKKQLALIGKQTISMETSFKSEHTNLVVELQKNLPDRFSIREPGEDELEKFTRIANSLFKVPFRRGKLERFADTTLVLIDFYPRELSYLGEKAGVQARAYKTLGYTAKKIALLTFAKLGENPRLCSAILEFFQNNPKAPYFKYGIEMMGAMRSMKFFPLLCEMLSNKLYDGSKTEIIKSLGAIGHPEGRETLLSLLEEILRSRLLDPPKMRDSEAILLALGKMTKSPSLSEFDRVTLTNEVIRLIPKSEQKLLMITALNFFEYKPEMLPPNSRNWAAEQLVQSLWLSEEAPIFVEGDEKETDVLGFRKALVKTLKSLGKDSLPVMLQTAERYIFRYCGAFLAMAEVLAEIGDVRAVPLLEKMTLQTFSADEDNIGKYQKEFYWDATSQKRLPLTKDKFISSLVYALDKIGGASADKTILNIADQYKRGIFAPPGAETATILMNATRRIDQASMASSTFTSSSQTTLPEDASLTESEKAMKSHRGEFFEEEINKAIKTLNKKGFLLNAASLRKEKIKAMQTLAENQSLEGVGAIVKHLNHKDTYLREAAVTALVDYTKNLKLESMRKIFFTDLLEALATGDETTVRKLAEILQSLASTSDQDYHFLVTYLDLTDNAKIKMRLGRYLREIEEKRHRKPVSLSTKPLEYQKSPFSDNSPNDIFEEPSEQETDAKKPLSFSEEFERKRLYMLARKEWIKQGKKGPPPEY